MDVNQHEELDTIKCLAPLKMSTINKIFKKAQIGPFSNYFGVSKTASSTDTLVTLLKLSFRMFEAHYHSKELHSLLSWQSSLKAYDFHNQAVHLSLKTLLSWALN